jgi:hypothetical protein
MAGSLSSSRTSFQHKNMGRMLEYNGTKTTELNSSSSAQQPATLSWIPIFLFFWCVCEPSGHRSSAGRLLYYLIFFLFLRSHLHTSCWSSSTLSLRTRQVCVCVCVNAHRHTQAALDSTSLVFSRENSSFIFVENIFLFLEFFGWSKLK